MRILYALSFCAVLAFPLAAQDDTKANDKSKGETAKKEPKVTKKAAPEIVEEEEEEQFTALTIGSKAPALDVEHWIQDGNGKYPHVTDFEKGKVYVVEFWATWCGPCIASMPHIAELQEQHSDTVQVVSITREDVETVNQFLKREVSSRGRKEAKEDVEEEEEEKPMTYRDLTSVYCLTADPDDSSSADYMEAAGQNGIPCAFLVGKTGEIEWIGHPMVMDEPLEAVLDDTWDRAAFKKEFELEQKVDLLRGQIVRFMRSGKPKQALKLLNESLSDEALKEHHDGLQTMKMQVLVTTDGFEEEAVEYMLARLNDKKHTPESANNLTWMIYQLADVGRFEDDEVTKKALQLAESKVEGSGQLKPYILDTVAHLMSLQGRIDEAIKAQKEAIELIDESQKDDLREFLNELKSQKGESDDDEEAKKDADEESDKDGDE